VLIHKLDRVENRYQEIADELSNPEIYNDPSKYQKLARESSSLKEIVDAIRTYKKYLADLESARQVLQDTQDDEIKELAEEELEELNRKKKTLEEEIRMMLIPSDPRDARNAIVEIRAGTGGDEAGLFAGDLFRMYSRYAEQKKWKLDIMNSSPQGIGGYREITFALNGQNVYGDVKFEGGVHRVQRVPETETGGRIHTSAASVAVLPEAEEIDVTIDPNDLKIDVYRSSGPGGQSVNTTDSAVRITHIPTGMVVTCQDEKSQHKNKAKALKVLRARLYETAMREEHEKLDAERRSMVSTGDRSAKIRTYNFPQNRVTDHRISLTLYRLEEILMGNLDMVIEKLKVADRSEKLKEVEA
jgi:peptide chain release factor 1